jgi:hypothetical protein
METNTPGKTCQQRIEEQFKERMEQLLPDVESWSVLKCARYLKSEGQELTTADLDELQSSVRELIREAAVRRSKSHAWTILVGAFDLVSGRKHSGCVERRF